MAEVEYGDVILCQVTSKPKKGAETVEIRDKDFQAGKLKITSYVRPRKIFTADLGLILYRDAICGIIKE